MNVGGRCAFKGIGVDNNTRIDNYLLGEPALSYYIEVDDKKILFDAGYSDVFIKNAKAMEVDLSKTTDVIVSHGHEDHIGGLEYLDLTCNLIAHNSCSLNTKNFNPILTKKPYQISENIIFLGEIENNQSEDIDDSALVIKTKRGLVTVCGCSHSGVTNIINYAKKITAQNQIYAIIGGFHLLDKKDDEIIEIAKFFQKENIEHIYPAHCCDLNSKIILSKYCKINEVYTGDIITL